MIKLLKNTFTPPPEFKFPITGGRRFLMSWMDSRPWIRYSVQNDSIFCSYCVCFGKENTDSPFVKKGFKNWKKASGVKDNSLDKHMHSGEHQMAEEKALNWLKNCKPGNDIASKITKQVAEEQIRSKKGILSIIDTIIALGQRGVALRGNWDAKQREEDGNFIFFLNWKAETDDYLAQHLKFAQPNAKYTSPQIQNEIISLCEKEIRDRIVQQIPKYWSVMADETQDCSTTEQLSICARFVNKDNEVCEEFLGFVKLTSMDAETVARNILDAIRQWGLNLECLVGQGYDGAAVMSSSINGVQAKIAAEFPNATYVHCRSHVLSLALSSSCKNVAAIRNVFDNVGKMTWFLGGSAKRKEIFFEAAAGNADDAVMELMKASEESNEASTESFSAIERASSAKTVPKFCPTRWTARVTTLSALLAKYRSVVQALEMIADRSKGDAQNDASAHLRLLSDSQFIVALVVAQAVLSFFACVTKTLQAKDCNLSEAYKDVHISKSCVQDNRTNEYWERLWVRIETIAQAVGTTVTKPRTANIQRHRANAGCSSDQTTSNYYKVNVFFPFVDHVVQEIEARFSQQHQGLVLADRLSMAMGIDTSDENEILKYYNKFLTFQEATYFSVEIAKWKKYYENMPFEERPANANSALSACNPQTFPAIHKILTILLTTPVGSVSCERSFSALRRLKLWNRSTMNEERLSGLGMLLIHRGTDYIPEPEVIYHKKQNWRK